MSDAFDPYYTWLAIPPEEQPPHHYRLLGLKPLEENLDVIEHAADRQMKHLRDFQSGKHGEDSQKLLNEVSAAKVTLLDPAKKTAYDTDLRAKLNLLKQAELKKAREERPLAVAKPLAAATPVAAAPAPTFVMNAPASRTAKKPNPLVLFGAIGSLALLVLLGGVVAAMMFLAGDQRVSAVQTPATVDDPSNDPPDVEPPSTTTAPPPVVPPVIPPPGDSEKPPTDPPPSVEDDPVVEPPMAEEEPTDEQPVAEPVDAEPKKLPVPDKAAREAKRKEILAIFPTAQAKSFDEKGQLAAQLIRTAGETVDDPAAVFALLNIAREQAAEAGHIKLAFEATDMLGETFDFDAAAVRIASLQQASRAQLPPAAKREIVIAGMDVIDELSAADKFDEAESVSERMLALARPLRDAELIKQLAEQKRAVGDLASSYKKAEAAFATLKTSSDDADANLAAGSYLAFVKQDWDAGLAHLAKGSDAALAAAAKAELASPTAAAAQEKLADDWWDASEAQKATASKNLCRAKAVGWYREVVDDLSGLAKVKVEKRIREAGDVVSLQPTRDRVLQLQVSAVIDGVDRLRVYATHAEWQHESWAWPADVKFNGQAWNPQESRVLQYTPRQVREIGEIDFSSAELAKSQGPGAVRLTKAEDHFEVIFDDVAYAKASGYEAVVVVRSKVARGRPIAQTNTDPDLGVVSRNPAELGGETKADVVYLDDLAESEERTGYHKLKKHGLGYSDDDRRMFRGESPEHSLSLHAESNDHVGVSYRLDGRYQTFEATAALWDARADNFHRAAVTPLTFSVICDGKVAWRSKPMQAHGSGQDCKVSIKGVDVLTLRVDCPGENGSAWSVWINPRLSRPKASSSTIAAEPDLGIFSRDPAELGQAPSKPADAASVDLWDMQEHGARLYSNRPLRMRKSVAFAGKAYEKSFGMQPSPKTSAHAQFTLAGDFVRFRGTVGLRDSGYKPSNAVTFRIQGDGKDLWTSPEVGQRKVSHAFDVDVTGVQTLTLRVDNPGSGNYCEPIWIEPRVTKAK